MEILDNFTFHNPTRIIFGKESVGQIGGVIKEAGVKRLLLVAGGGSIRKNGVYDTVARSLKEAGLTWVEAWGVRPNPVLAKAREIIALAQKEKVDAVLAVGGGSVIDTAKSVAAGVFLPDLWAAFRAPGGGHDRPAHLCGPHHERHRQRNGPPGGADP